MDRYLTLYDILVSSKNSRPADNQQERLGGEIYMALTTEQIEVMNRLNFVGEGIRPTRLENVWKGYTSLTESEKATVREAVEFAREAQLTELTIEAGLLGIEAVQ